MEEQEEGRLLRKIRKKLRQIENLECLERELNEEEAAKVERKNSLRTELASILGAMKRRSNEETVAAVAHSGSGASSPKKKRQEEDAIASSPSSSSSATNLAQEEQLEISIPTAQPPDSTDRSVTSTTTAGGAPSSPSQEFVQVRVSTPAGRSTAGSRGSSTSRCRHLVEDLVNREVIVYDLGGHEDLAVAAAVDSCRDIAITGARDTRVLVWKPSTKEQLVSLRGHTGSVTGLLILPPAANARLGCSIEDVIGVSSSTDCCLKVWNLSKGELVKSIYTYNGIKCLAYSEEMDMILTGTESGKLEFFDFAEADAAVHSIKDAHEEAITAVDFSARRVASGSRDGIVKIWEYDGKKLARCLFASEDVSAAADEHATHLRCIAALRLLPYEDLVAYGDSGCNVKILQWKCGLLHKLPNHTGEHGFTDCLELSGDLLAATSYDVDTGQGHVNVFRVTPGQIVPTYLCSWSDEETSRIHGLGVSGGGGGKQLCYVTCGKEVKLWRTIRGRRDLPREEDAVVVRSSMLPLFSDEAVDSGSSDDDEELTDTESENDAAGGRRSRSRDRRHDEGGNNSKWWCTVM